MRSMRRDGRGRGALAAGFGIFLAVAAFPESLAQDAAVREDVAARVRAASREHPRLFLSRAEETALKRRIAADPLLSKALDHVTSLAGRMADVEPVEHRKVGRRLLDQSRRCLKRLAYLSFVHRLTGEHKYLERARKEMLAAAGFADWNPSHFLDVAEMTAALALGYDWLYESLDPDTRAKIRTAIVEKGLKPSLKVRGGWTRGTNNWNQVCHGGMTLGALAVLEDEPELAAQIVSRAVDGVPRAMAEYAPDGAYPEGPGYWGYGTSYNVVLLAALESVLGTDFGLAAAEGFMKTPDYYIHVTGPTGLFFNYSDCGSRGGVDPAMYWFAAKRKEPGLLWFEKGSLEKFLAGSHSPESSSNRFFPFLLLWSGPGAALKPPAELHWTGGGKVPVSFHRSGWDEGAAFVAVKGGSPSASHAHMDAGTFVMDADGVRWAEDLGMQSYHELESQGVALWDGRQTGGRWTVFRLNNRSHNTLVVNDRLQEVKGRCPIVRFSKDGPMTFTIVDLGSVYEGQLARAARGVGLRADRSVLVQDEIEAAGAKAGIRWGMVTRAEVKIAGDGTALLEQGGRTLGFRVLEPEGVKLKIYRTDPPPAKHDAPNRATRMIGFEVALEPSAKARLAVWLVPGDGAKGSPPSLKPLASW